MSSNSAAGATLVDTIKDLLKEELTAFRDDQAKFNQAQEDSLKAIQEVSAKTVQNEREIEQLKESVGRYKTESDDANEKFKTQADGDVKAMEQRLDKFEKQVTEDCSRIDKVLVDLQPKIDDSLRLVKICELRSEEFDRMLRDLSRQSEEVTAKMKAAEERMVDIDGIAVSVQRAQEALEDSVTRKYNSLWEDVLNAIKETKGNQLELMQKDMQNQAEAHKVETRSMVTYALNFMASAHGERRQMAVNKSLLLAWKEQTWISARRRMGISYLNNMFQRRQRTALDNWHRRHSTSVLCDRLHQQYTDQLQNVYKDIATNDNYIQKRCEDLANQVSNMCTKKSLTEQVEQFRHLLTSELKALDSMKHKVDAHEGTLKMHGEQLRPLQERIQNGITRLGQEIAELGEGYKSCAKSEEVNGMIRDILLIWNSIKQLDTAKADKKDVDSFALETLDRDKLAGRKLEDLEKDFVSKSRQESQKLQEKWLEFDGRLDESGRQFRHWEQMWEKLSGFVEDLVAKIGDLQAAATEQKVGGLRGRDSSRSRFARSQAEIPPLPGTQPGPVHPGQEMAATQRFQQAGGVDSKMLWLNSAKGIVDANIDQAVNPAGATVPRVRTRPQSAPRRPLDRRM